MGQEIIIKDGRGSFCKAISDENRKIVQRWFLKNPNKTMKECSDSIGLSYGTIRKHVLNIRNKQFKK